MTPDTRDELILKHLDGDTSPEEGKRVTKLLAEDETFRIRFFTFVHQVAKIRELTESEMNQGPTASIKTERGAPVNGVQPAQPVRRRAHQADATPEPASPFDLRRIYFNAVLGGAGGLLGWIAVTLAAVSGVNIYLADAINGVLIGVCIGLAIGSTEGLVASQSLKRLCRGAGYGAALGALGGLIGLVLGELIFSSLGGGVWPRAIGWSIFGVFVGTSDGFAEKMPSKIRYGILGGLLGGMIGGSTYEALLSLLYQTGYLALARSWGSAIGLIILGACIGALMGLVEALLRPAWVFFLTGRLEGQTRTLDNRRTITIGTSDACSIVVPGDASVAPVHAEVVFADGQFVIRPRDGKVIVRRETQELEVTNHALQARDRIQLGNTKMIFRTEEGRKKKQ